MTRKFSLTVQLVLPQFSIQEESLSILVSLGNSGTVSNRSGDVIYVRDVIAAGLVITDQVSVLIL
jgi:hypothetical protein